MHKLFWGIFFMSLFGISFTRVVKTAQQGHLRLTLQIWQECVVSDNSSVQSKYGEVRGHFYSTCMLKCLKLVCVSQNVCVDSCGSNSSVSYRISTSFKPVIR